MGGGRSDAHTVVCVDGEARLSWSDVVEQRATVAAALRALPGVEPVLATSDPFHFLVALLGCWTEGRDPLVPPNFQPATVAQYARSDRVVIDDSWMAALAPASSCADTSRPRPEHGLTLYTSGSTGHAKPVFKSLAQLGAEIEVLADLWEERFAGATVLATVPHHHLYGLLFRLLLPLAVGCAFDRRTCLDADELQAAIARRGRHVLLSSPAHLARLPQLLAFERWVPCPRAVFSSGAPLDAESATLYRARLGSAPIEVLGSTESGGIAYRQRDGGAAADAWTPLPTVTIARAADGALVATSPWSDGAIRLEDEITLEDGGRFRLGTRMDRIVKLEGKRVSLPEIEARLGEHSWVAAAAVEPVPRGGRLGAVLVLSEAGTAVARQGGRAAVVRALREHLRATIERVAVPRRFRIVTQLPLNERGKIDRSALLSLLSDDHDVAA